MIVPLAMTIYFSTLHYILLDPGRESFVWLANFRYFLTDPAFLTSLQITLEMVGSIALSTFIYLSVPHLARPITVVILIETIFLLTVFAEIFVTTGGGPGLQTTNIAFLIYSQALIQFDVGNASAGGLVAVVIANIVAFFLVRIIGRNLEA